MTARSLMLAGLGVLALAGEASAQPAQSNYTDVDLNQCTVIESDDFGTMWACPGFKGIPVMVSEVDLRMMVSYGLTSTTEKAAQQTLPPFNRLGDKIEWRVSMVDGHLRPFATILRFLTQREGTEKPGEVLVVTKVVPGATCQVAYVDALANPDANELARRTADEKAPGFDCENGPEYVGKFEAWER